MAAWAIAVTLVASGCSLRTGGVDPISEAAQGASDGTVSPPGVLRPRGGRAWSDYFPNVVLTSHNGEQVRFYDDLIKGKTVVINFMYATCTDS